MRREERVQITRSKTTLSLQRVVLFMEYTYNNEKVVLERWGWGVVYKDGRELRQFGKTGDFHRFSEIEQEHVRMFCMFRTDNMAKRIDVLIPAGAKIIHKYVNTRPFYKKEFVRSYCFGYKLGSHHVYNFILPDDRIVMSNTDNIDLVKFKL